MKRSLTVAVFGLLFGVAGCGGGDGGSGNNGTFSCDVVSGGTHGCTDYGWSGGVYTTVAWNSACTQAGGTVVGSCAHSGSAGACRVVTTSGAVSITTTNWFYGSTTAADIKTACNAQVGTYVAP